jgi:hypothetical protein
MMGVEVVAMDTMVDPGLTQGSWHWWVRAVLVTVVGFLLGMGIAGMLMAPFVGSFGDLDRDDRILAWLPGVVTASTAAGLLAALGMGLRRRELVVPATAPLVVALVGYLLGAAGVLLGGWGEALLIGLEITAILVALRFGPVTGG